MSKQKFNTTPSVRRHGVFAVIGEGGKITGYVNRSLVNPSFNRPLLAFESAGKAKQAVVKLNFAGNKFGKWAYSQAQAVAIWNAELIKPEHTTLAWVICYRPRYLRPDIMPYYMRPFVEVDEPDASIIYETTNHTGCEFVREILRREWLVNNVTATSAQDVLNIINAYSAEVI